MRRIAAGLSALFLLSQPAHAQALSPCERAGRDAERQYALPSGLLAAIGRVESGRWDTTLGRIVPSPLAIGAAGQPHFTDSPPAAVQRLRELQAGGLRNIDVGCFQINLEAHPAAFPSIEQAFDPAANADYAARFLTSLRTRLGNWEDAVAAYHSATPARGLPYRALVFASWATPEGWQRALAASPLAASPVAKPRDPLTVFTIAGAEIRVWTPSAVGSAAASVAMTTVSTSPLPRVLTPADAPRRGRQ